MNGVKSSESDLVMQLFLTAFIKIGFDATYCFVTLYFTNQKSTLPLSHYQPFPYMAKGDPTEPT